MNKMKLKHAVLAAMTATLLVGAVCTSTTVTAMPGAWNPKPMAPGSYTVLNGGKPVSGKVTVELTGDEKPMTSSLMRQAVDQALRQCQGADALVDTTQDIQVITKSTMIGPFHSMKMTYTVFLTGIPVKTKDSVQVKPVRSQE